MGTDLKPIVQGNILLEASYKISLDEYRLLNLALSQVDSMNPKPDTPYEITPENYRDAYGINPKHMHTKIKDAASGLLRKPITLYHEKNGRIMKTERPWFSIIEYDTSDDDRKVVLEFSKYVCPYLYELKRDFTSVNFEDVAKLDTSFSVRLYLWLSRARLLHKTKKGDVTIVTLEIDWMKERAGLSTKYSDFRIFRRKLIEPSIERINRNTELSVTFSTDLKAGKANSITFSYIIERGALSKAKRERLPRRPKVTAGSHAEGVWAQKCISIMTDYELELLNEGKPLPLGDLKKLSNWYAITGDGFAKQEVDLEIAERSLSLGK